MGFAIVCFRNCFLVDTVLVSTSDHPRVACDASFTLDGNSSQQPSRFAQSITATPGPSKSVHCRFVSVNNYEGEYNQRTMQSRMLTTFFKLQQHVNTASAPTRAVGSHVLQGKLVQETLSAGAHGTRDGQYVSSKCLLFKKNYHELTSCR